MKKFLISTDTSCDMPEELWAAHSDLLVCMLPFSINGVDYTQNDTLSYTDYYSLLESGKLAQTSQVNQYEASIMFDKYMSEGYDIIHIGLSSGVSASHVNFEPTVKELRKKHPDRKIEVIDSLCGSGGLGILINECCKCRNNGKNFDETVEYITKLVPHILPIFIVDDLRHLRNGGRISGLEARLGSLLDVKPILKINLLGKIVVESKARGMKKAISIMIKNIIASFDLLLCDYLILTHGDSLDIAKKLGEQLVKLTGIKVLISPLNKVIGAHTGKGTIAVFYAGTARI